MQITFQESIYLYRSWKPISAQRNLANHRPQKTHTPSTYLLRGAGPVAHATLPSYANHLSGIYLSISLLETNLCPTKPRKSWTSLSQYISAPGRWACRPCHPPDLHSQYMLLQGAGPVAHATHPTYTRLTFSVHVCSRALGLTPMPPTRLTLDLHSQYMSPRRVGRPAPTTSRALGLSPMPPGHTRQGGEAPLAGGGSPPGALAPGAQGLVPRAPAPSGPGRVPARRAASSMVGLGLWPRALALP